MITEKENFLRLLRGEMPEFIPRYNMMTWNFHGRPFPPVKTPEGYDKDEFGMLRTTTEESMGGGFPVPGIVLLEDITKWRDVIKMPDLSTVDWDAFAKRQYEGKDPNNPKSVMIGDFIVTLINWMSFTEGLIALQEEPEECYALLEYLCDYYCEVLKKCIYLFKPEILHLVDDVAADQMPFISLETYRTLIKPHHKRLADIALDNDMLITMHCCGKCDSFIDDWAEMGVTGWEPAQAGNDFAAIKKKYGPKMVIMGGWDNTGPISMPETSDDELREALIKYVDEFAPGGGFAYGARVATSMSKEDAEHKNAICEEIYFSYARDWYKHH